MDRCRGPSLLYIAEAEDPFVLSRMVVRVTHITHGTMRPMQSGRGSGTVVAQRDSLGLRPTDFLRIPYVTVAQLLPIHSSLAAGCNNSRPRKNRAIP